MVIVQYFLVCYPHPPGRAAQVVHIGMELCCGGTVDSWLESRHGSLLPADVILDCFLQVKKEVKNLGVYDSSL